MLEYPKWLFHQKFHFEQFVSAVLFWIGIFIYLRQFLNNANYCYRFPYYLFVFNFMVFKVIQKFSQNVKLNLYYMLYKPCTSDGYDVNTKKG